MAEPHAHSPLTQFEVKPLIELPPVFGHDISFTNSSLYMLIAIAAIVVFVLATGWWVYRLYARFRKLP